MSSRLRNLHVECKKYHFKKYLKIVLSLVALIVLPLGAFFLNEYLNSDKVISKLDKSLMKKEIKKVELKEENKTVKIKEISQKKYAVYVSTDKLEKSIKNATINKPKAKIKNKAIVVEKVKQEPKEVVKEKELKKEKVKPRKNFFADSDSSNTIEDWISKYESKKTYALAIYISSYYYKRKEFKLSGIWARRANKLDREKEKAWLLYAKSVYAVGDKRKARDILNLFMQYRESAKAEMLLADWED